jgi:sugar O-acyltransferase (sialic acid O-acetyltransferase NeuD family)
VAEAALLNGTFNFLGFVDDSAPEESTVLGYPILSSTRELSRCRELSGYAFVAIGSNQIRERLQNSVLACGFNLATIIHPKACVSPSAAIGVGSVVLAGAIVGTEVTLGDGVIVNCGAIVDHDCVIGNFAHLGVGVHMSGGVKVGPRALVGAGCSLGYGVIIGAAAKIEVGSSLTNPGK